MNIKVSLQELSPSETLGEFYRGEIIEGSDILGNKFKDINETVFTIGDDESIEIVDLDINVFVIILYRKKIIDGYQLLGNYESTEIKVSKEELYRITGKEKKSTKFPSIGQIITDLLNRKKS